MLHNRNSKFEIRKLAVAFAGEIWGGAQLHVTNRDLFRPSRARIEIIRIVRRMYGDFFKWKDPPLLCTNKNACQSKSCWVGPSPTFLIEILAGEPKDFGRLNRLAPGETACYFFLSDFGIPKSCGPVAQLVRACA
jgi:hypothetical protein